MEWFSDPVQAAFANWVVAVIASLVGLAAFVLGLWNQYKQGKLQDRLVEIEEGRDQSRQKEARKAKLRAEIIASSSGTTKQSRLQIRNEGEATARKIVACLDDIPIKDHPVFPRNQNEITEIGPHSVANYIVRC